jgi:hypothetical protein
LASLIPDGLYHFCCEQRRHVILLVAPRMRDSEKVMTD